VQYPADVLGVRYILSSLAECEITAGQRDKTTICQDIFTFVWKNSLDETLI